MEDMLKQILSGQQQLNKKLDDLLKNQRQSVPDEIAELVDFEAAKSILNRGRTWITTRMINANEVTAQMNTAWFLVKGLDWHREGRIIMFKRKSLIRLRDEMKRMGEMYEAKIGQA